MSQDVQVLNVAAYIKEVGRGQKGARDLPREDAERVFGAMLDGRIPDLQLGALLVALRIKGESLEELAGFLAACEASYPHIASPAGRIPIVIPSYNGARQLPNLVPLLAFLLARKGIPVLLHGITRDPGRVSTLEVLEALAVPAARSAEEALDHLRRRALAFIPVEVLAPGLARLLAVRRQIGVRGPGHTVAKMLNPFSGRSLRLVSVTHPDYLARMREFFTAQPHADALVLRGAEGEAIAHPRRRSGIEWVHRGQSQTLALEPAQGEEAVPLPQTREAEPTARWIERALAGTEPVPRPIEFQIACCLRALAAMRSAASRPG